MNDWIMPLAVVGSIVLVGSIVWFGWHSHKKRVAAFHAFAGQRAWVYTERDDALARRYGGTPFGRGKRPKAKHVLSGRFRDRGVTCFDYEYITQSQGSNGQTQTQTHRYAIFTVALPAFVPTLEVSREGLLSSIGRKLGVHDIELESEDFNRRFKVISDDRKLAYDVLHPRMMEWLLHNDGPPWRFEGDALVAWVKGRLQLDQVDGTLHHLCTLLDAVPRLAWDRRPA